MKTDTVNTEKWAFDGMECITSNGEVIADIRSCNHDGEEIENLVFNRSTEEAQANAELIVQAVNACKEINPDNPLNVAKAIPEMLKMLKHFEACLTGENPMPRSVLLNHVVKTINQIIQKQ